MSFVVSAWEIVRPYILGSPAPIDDVEALRLKLAEENAKLEAEIREARELVRTRERDLSEVQEKLADSLVQTGELTARVSALNELLSERTTELRAAQAFLTRVDAVSEAELVGMVDGLNSLISSASGTLSEAWDQRDPVLGVRIKDIDSGPIRNNFVLEQAAARNHVAVNLAVQMCLGNFVVRVASGWGGGQLASTLSEIYGMISTEESQAIASRWRTLTKRHMPHQEPPRSEEVIDSLAQVLMITRSFSGLSEAINSVADLARTEVEAIIEATVELDDIMKTKIASSDTSVYVASPGTIFDKGTMTDEFGVGGEGQIVAGTTEVGLIRRSGKVEKVLRKAKVILERDLVGPEDENETSVE